MFEEVVQNSWFCCLFGLRLIIRHLELAIFIGDLWASPALSRQVYQSVQVDKVLTFTLDRRPTPPFSPFANGFCRCHLQNQLLAFPSYIYFCLFRKKNWTILRSRCIIIEKNGSLYDQHLCGWTLDMLIARNCKSITWNRRTYLRNLGCGHPFDVCLGLR
jgi:hypothetical protein